MGSSVLLDIIGSTIVAGLLLMCALRLDTQAIENSFAYNTGANLQLGLVSLVTEVENDFRKIGYCQDATLISPATKAVLYADTSDFKYQADINNDGSIDQVEYLLGPPISGSLNPRLRILVRKVLDGKTSVTTIDSIKIGVTQFYFKYYASGTEDSIRVMPVDLVNNAVGLIDLQISIESPEKTSTSTYYSETDTSLYKIYWRQVRVAAKNLTWR